jgi:PHD/YefM family antitoxin component YafN of YafNO toxin-antitoxin module
MIDLSNHTDSLTNFQQDTPAFLDRLRQTGQPVVLTINGKAELVVQDAASYQKMLNQLERNETIKQVQEALDEINSGKGLSLDEFKQQVREKHGLPV